MYVCMYVRTYVRMYGSLLTCPVHVLLHVPSAELKSTGKDFNLGEGNKGKRATIPLHGHCVYRSTLNFLRCFCFSVSGKGEMFFTVIANTLLAD